MAENKELVTGGSADLALQKAGSLLSVTNRILAKRANKQLLKEAYYQSFQDKLKDGGLAPKMMRLKGGEFRMGSPESEPERDDDERLHFVSVADFAMGQYAVTFADYDIFCKATNRTVVDDEEWGRGLRPVINVSWFDAVTYCEWLCEQTGKDYRLPTEAEWEFACRAGTTTPFSFGKTLSSRQANYDGNYPYNDGEISEYRKKTVPVGSFSANSWGLYDMHGNVWEWTASAYEADYQGKELEYLSNNDANNDSLVIRGGSWNNSPRRLRSANRFYGNVSNRNYNLGFRISRTR